MSHFTDEELSWHALEADPAIKAHLSVCEVCSGRYAAIQRIDTSLANPATWQFPVDYRGTADATRRALETIEARLNAEIADAKASLEALIHNEMAFIWEDVSRKPRFHNAGAVRVLCDAASEYLERNPLHARNLADAALAIARSLERGHYLGRKVHQLVGRALKEKADAQRYLGDLREALSALDDARIAYDRAGVTPWEYGVLLYVRGVVYVSLGDLLAADACARDSARLFTMSGDKTRLLHARLLGATVAWVAYDFRRARTEYQHVLDAIDRAENELLAARVTGYIANCDLHLGNTQTAAPALTAVLQTYARFGLLTEVARTRWVLARVPLAEGRFTEAIPLLRASKTELEQLHQSHDAALATLDLAEALIESTGGVQEGRRLCRELVAVFRAERMLKEALTAAAYLREHSRTRTITPGKIRHVRHFLERLQLQPSLAFVPPPE